MVCSKKAYQSKERSAPEILPALEIFILSKAAVLLWFLHSLNNQGEHTLQKWKEEWVRDTLYA